MHEVVGTMWLMSARVAVPAAAVLLLTGLAGCGGDDTAPADSLTKDEQTVADNLAAQIVRSGSMSGDASESSVTDEQASCIGEGAVTEVGLDALQDYGIVTEELLVDRGIQGVEMDQGDADALAGVFIGCIDAEALFEQRFLNQLPPGGSEQDRRACVEDAVGEDAVQEVLSASFQGARSRAYPKLERDVAACAEGEGAGQ